MARKKGNTRLRVAMDWLNMSAAALAEESGVDRTLISRWLSGERVLTARSKQLRPLAEALLRLDRENNLDTLLAPFRQQGEDRVDTLCEYLLGEEIPGLVARTQPPPWQQSGEYITQVRVFLGQKGFQKAALAMLDYLMLLPPDRELTVLCQGRYDWVVSDLTFLMQFITKLRRAIGRGTRLQVINRKGYSIAETSAFAGAWLVAHLKGYIRSRYYEGDMPENTRFIALIPDYWGGTAEEDAVADDNLFLSMYTEPRIVQRVADVCERYRQISYPASQYGFLKHPMGIGENRQLWHPGALRPWNDGVAADGSFHAICSVPGFGVITREEFEAMRGPDTSREVPMCLFASERTFVNAPHRIILCHDEVREALCKQRRMHGPLSDLLGRRVFIPTDMLLWQLRRILAAMEQNEAFEVALMPRVAFEKLQLELVCFQNSVSVGWLQDMEESVFADDQATSGSFHGAIDYTWGKLLRGWKRRDRVMRTLRKWTNGRGLDEKERVTSAVKSWDTME